MLRVVLHHVRRRTAGDDSGSMLIEIIVSMVIFGILATGLAGLAISVGKTSNLTRIRAEATQLANKDLDVVRAAGVGTTAGTTTQTVVSKTNNVTYSIKRQIRAVAPGSSSCGGSSASQYIRVITTVSWTSPSLRQNSPPVVASTFITPPKGTYDTVGAYAVIVTDRNGAGINNMAVDLYTGATATGAKKTLFTDSDGCVIFDQLAPNTYTAALPSTPTYVPKGFMLGVSTNPYQQSNTVAAGGMSNWAATYDLAGSIKLNAAVTDVGHPIPSNVPFTLYNPNFASTGTLYTSKYTIASGTQPMFATGMSAGNNPLTANTFTALYPDTAGYIPWAGDCTDSDPDIGNSGVSRRGAVVTVTPGGSASGSTVVPPINLNLTGLTVGKSLSVTIKHSTTLGSCPTSGESYTVAPSSVFTATTATAAAVTVPFSLPYGSWVATVVCGTKTTTTAMTTITGNTGVTLRNQAMAVTCA